MPPALFLPLQSHTDLTWSSRNQTCKDVKREAAQKDESSPSIHLVSVRRDGVEDRRRLPEVPVVHVPRPEVVLVGLPFRDPFLVHPSLEGPVGIVVHVVRGVPEGEADGAAREQGRRVAVLDDPAQVGPVAADGPPAAAAVPDGRSRQTHALQAVHDAVPALDGLDLGGGGVLLPSHESESV
jgi:hypothetical protein